MHTRILAALVLLALPGALLAGATLDFRIFTNREGVEITAALVAVRDGKATLQKKDGKSYAVPVATLSDDDKEYIKSWMEENIHVNLDIRFEKERLGTAKRDGKEVSDWIFNVTVTNRGFDDLADVTFKYAIFKELNDRYAKERNAVTGAMVGSVEPRNLPKTQSFAFKTGAMRIEKETSKTYTGTVNGVRQYDLRKWDESLCGIRLEIYVKDKLVDEREFGRTAALREPDAPK